MCFQAIDNFFIQNTPRIGTIFNTKTFMLVDKILSSIYNLNWITAFGKNHLYKNCTKLIIVFTKLSLKL